MVVAVVAAGGLTLQGAIPIIMGAVVGTGIPLCDRRQLRHNLHGDAGGDGHGESSSGDSGLRAFSFQYFRCPVHLAVAQGACHTGKTRRMAGG